MTLAEQQQDIKELGARIRAAATRLAEAAADRDTPMEDLETQRGALRDMNSRMSAMQAAYDAQYAEGAEGLPGGGGADAAGNRGQSPLRDMLKSNEYARAFADAIRAGAKYDRMTDPGHKVLYDALTIAGDPAGGQDGGFLVPEDIDHSIRERRRALMPLADLFSQEATSTNSGWRVMDVAPTAGMTALDSEIPAGGVPMDDQPKFEKVPYSLTTYGLNLPLSKELAADEVANLFGYIAGWFAKKQVLTENLLLRAVLAELVSSQIVGDLQALDSIKAVLNKDLDPAISLTASILTNQDGYHFLDTLKDENGRPLLQPDPTQGTGMMLKGRPVKVASNWLLPSQENAAGEYYPIYIGDFAQYATLFTRQPLEVASTDIGGQAWRSNSVEVRGISRMGVAAFDKGAVVRRAIFIEAE